MNIYILDPDDLSILTVVNSYSARTWSKVWSESGYFTIWAPITPENKEFLVPENLVWPDDQFCIGVIEYIHRYTSEDSMPFLEVSGYFSERAYLSRRILWGNELVVNSPANILKTIIQDHSVNCSDSNRRLGEAISSSILISASIPIQSSVTYCNSYGNLWEEVKKISLEYGLHMEFQYQQQTLTGIIFSGVDRSLSVNLSTDLGFLTDSDYRWDSTDYCNAALIAGEGEGANRITASIVSTAIKRDRRELYVDARDLQKTSASSENPMSDEEYTAALIQRGQNKLLDHPLYESYSCSLQLTGEEGYVFEKDYNLGDIVTLTDSTLGIQVKARVKEHQIDEDKDGRTDTLVFGISVPTITALVKRRT